MDIEIKRARWQDRFAVWLWRNDPQTRDMERDPAAVPWDSFKLRFRVDIADPRRRLMLAERGFDSLGMGYITVKQGLSAVMGINLNPAFRGQRLAAPLIEQFIAFARREMVFNHLTAHIRHENTPSRRAFEKAGFQLQEEGGGICLYARDLIHSVAPKASRQA